METLIDKFKKQGKGVVTRLREELKTIRTGRASSAVLEDIKIQTYQGQTELKLMELATITNEGPQTLIIQPFDPSTIADIEKGLLQSPLGINPIVQNQRIIVKFPPLSEEQRQKIIKLVNQKVEEARIQMRNKRNEIRKKIRSLYEKKQVTEDEKFRLEKLVDKAGQDLNKEILEVKEAKEKEITQF